MYSVFPPYIDMYTCILSIVCFLCTLTYMCLMYSLFSPYIDMCLADALFVVITARISGTGNSDKVSRWHIIPLTTHPSFSQTPTQHSLKHPPSIPSNTNPTFPQIPSSIPSNTHPAFPQAPMQNSLKHPPSIPSNTHPAFP